MLAPVTYGLAAFAGDIEVLFERPNKVSLGAAESAGMMVIQERNDTVDTLIAVDALISGPVTLSTSNVGTMGSLDIGTDFTSYLLQFDPVGSDGLTMESIAGVVEFERDILAILFDDVSLADTDALLGSIGDYGDQADRGLQLAGNDLLIVSEDLRSLSFSLAVPGDELIQFRVITEQLIPADLNNDGAVDGLDLALWDSSYGLNGNADIDGDGDADGADFLAYQRQYTGSLDLFAATSAAIPEPTTCSLAMVLLLTGLAFRRGIESV